MKNASQRPGRISKARSRLAPVALAFVVVLVVATVATSSAHAQTFTLLYSFQGPPLDGSAPHGELTFDKVGNLYGTALFGGSSALSAGTVFELDTSGKETVLHSFTGVSGDGAYPVGQVVRVAGNVYGVTGEGGGTACFSGSGCGTIFELSQGEETVVYSLTVPEGNSPFGGVSRDAAGNLYGTTLRGNTGTPPPACGGCGIVFEVSGGQETVLHTFGGTPDGANPYGSLLVDKLGNVYGTTESGGQFGQGAVFELSPNSDGTWTERVIHSFHGNNGAAPVGGLIADANGSLYGTTGQGGPFTPTGCSTGCGVVFKLKKNLDDTWTERVLYSFGGTADDGHEPFGNVVRDKQGNLYGVTSGGGAADFGTVFEVDPAGNERVLHSFTGGLTDGEIPFAGLSIDASGNLYGTTADGGAGPACNGNGGCGVVFKITP